MFLCTIAEAVPKAELRGGLPHTGGFVQTRRKEHRLVHLIRFERNLVALSLHIYILPLTTIAGYYMRGAVQGLSSHLVGWKLGRPVNERLWHEPTVEPARRREPAGLRLRMSRTQPATMNGRLVGSPAGEQSRALAQPAKAAAARRPVLAQRQLNN